MRKSYLFLLVLFFMFLGCVKQSKRYNEPELVPANYNLVNAKLRPYYYKKHLSGVLERQTKFAIEPGERGYSKDQNYSRIVVADIVTKDEKGKNVENRNRVVAIENYSLKDKTGFNPYDYIMVSKHIYNYKTDKVFHYKVKNGDPEQVQEMGNREMDKKELNAYLLSDIKLFNVVFPLYKATGEKFKKIKAKVLKEHGGKNISDFLLKKVKLLKKVVGKLTGGENIHANLTMQVILPDNKLFSIQVLYVPKNIVEKIKEGHIYRNIVVSLNDNIIAKGIVMLGGSSASIKIGKDSIIIADYVRGLEDILNEPSQNKEDNQKSEEKSEEKSDNQS